MTGSGVPQSRLILGSSIAETRRLHAWLDQVFAAASPTDRLENAIRLCLEEAVMNVIAHGYATKAGEIEVVLLREPGGYCAQVTDTAPPFDPVAAPLPPTSRPSLQAGPIGGRGLGLMRQFATSIRYERTGGKNRLTMRFAD